jgi:hypothetical protein
MPNVNDGGPAFPKPLDPYPNAQGMENGSQGMSLRDWFAGMEKAPDDLSVGYAEALVGRPHPHKETSLGAINPDATIATIEFWAEAEARYRYIKADSMLKAREA